jgi:hypothetical protein
MRLHIPCILFLLVATLTSCRPSGFEIGGGGSTHIPPGRLVQCEPTTLELELSVWGEGSGAMSKRWKAVRCHYRITGEAQYTAIDMTIEEETKNKILFACTIPPQPNAGSTLEYYFDMMLDGHYNKRDGGTIDIQPSTNNSMPAIPKE